MKVHCHSNSCKIRYNFTQVRKQFFTLKSCQNASCSLLVAVLLKPFTMVPFTSNEYSFNIFLIAMILNAYKNSIQIMCVYLDMPSNEHFEK